jgi:hypothetical protein
MDARRNDLMGGTHSNKSPLTKWGDVLHDVDLAETIVDRPLERVQLLILDGPSRHTPRIPELALDNESQPATFS